jgi:hypothetical protein
MAFYRTIQRITSGPQKLKKHEIRESTEGNASCISTIISHSEVNVNK